MIPHSSAPPRSDSGIPLEYVRLEGILEGSDLALMLEIVKNNWTKTRSQRMRRPFDTKNTASGIAISISPGQVEDIVKFVTALRGGAAPKFFGRRRERISWS